MIIDNNIDRDCWGAADFRRHAAQAVPGATVYVRRAPQGDLPESPESYDRIIVSGSKTSALAEEPWISKLHDFIKRALDLSKPFLGVCYGHQSLVRALGGMETVGKAAKGEVGWTKIELLGGAPLFEGIDQSFYSFSSHFEEVKKLPAGMRHLARSQDCAIQACQLGDKPVYGIQFHAEKDLEAGEQTFASKKKEGMNPKLFLGAGAGKKLFDPKVSDRLFKNFLTT